MKKSVIERILEKTEIITESGCWIFTGATTSFGYGLIGLGGRSDGTDRVHRVIYKKMIGEIPKGFFVCHKCDIPSCCNPSHLFIGTARDNHADMTIKKRGTRPPVNKHDIGSYRYNAKLTEDVVVVARMEKSLGEKSSYKIWKELESKYGVSWGVVQRMLNGKSWKHVKC